MIRFIKYFTYSIIILIFISFITGFFLSKIGLETSRFNSLIIERVKNYNNNFNLDIKKVKIYLNFSNITNPKIEVKSQNAILAVGKRSVKLDTIKTEIDIFSYFKDQFLIEKFFIESKNNKIRDLISIAALEKPNLILYKMFIKDGDINLYGDLNFDLNGNLIDYSFKGKIKDANIKYGKKYSFKKLNFNFFYDKKTFVIKNTDFYFNNIKFLSNQINIPVEINDGARVISGDIRNDKKTINLNLLKNLFNSNFTFLKNQKITFETRNNFSFKIKKGKIKELQYLSEINLDNLILNFNNTKLKEYFNNYNNSIFLKNNLIKIVYKDEILNLDGVSEYSFDDSFQSINYTIDKKKNIYNFLSSISINNNPLLIESINYFKEKDKESNLKLKGSYNLEKVIFKEINYNEGSNFFEVKDLILNNDLKILDINTIKIDYVNNNKKKNQLNLKKKLNTFNLTGKSFDSYKLINNILSSDEGDDFFKIFKFADNKKLNILVDKVYLNKIHYSKNLSGQIIIKNNKINSLNLQSDLPKNKKFKLNIKTVNGNEKITTFFSDNAEPFVKYYSFIKGFSGGIIDFYSVKINNKSTSILNMSDFKVKEMPALTKLLSLASLQGIADVMTGEGIRFNEFEMNFNNENKLMTIKEIYAIGPAISILMNGYLESKKLVSLRGTLVPATTLNKVIGSIPFIGKILVGEKTGEGVFGVSFKIKGPPKKLKTSVNPIKTLTPRFITRTLQKTKK